MPQEWENKIRKYCHDYNVPLEYLSDTLYEPKVIPMIRGKAFEFSVMLKLKSILPQEDWIVEKEQMNAQQGFHDIDVKVTHRHSGKVISVECKLAAKGRYKHARTGEDTIAVKCMRSRTLGASMAQALAPRLGIPARQLSVHNDQYVPTDFDIVITSIGNAFYETDPEGRFIWDPSTDGEDFLRRIGGEGDREQLKDFAFQTMFVAPAADLAIHNNGLRCTRRACRQKAACGFIPNYPIIKFDQASASPEQPWVHIQDSLNVFSALL